MASSAPCIHLGLISARVHPECVGKDSHIDSNPRGVVVQRFFAGLVMVADDS